MRQLTQSPTHQPTHPPPDWRSLARLLGLRGKVDESEARLLSLSEASEEHKAAQPEEHARAAAALRGLRAALEMKAEGNACYKAGQYERAYSHYTEALAADVLGGLKVALLGNRAQSLLKVGKAQAALDDIGESLKVESSYPNQHHAHHTHHTHTQYSYSYSYSYSALILILRWSPSR